MSAPVSRTELLAALTNMSSCCALMGRDDLEPEALQALSLADLRRLFESCTWELDAWEVERKQRPGLEADVMALARALGDEILTRPGLLEDTSAHDLNCLKFGMMRRYVARLLADLGDNA